MTREEDKDIYTQDGTLDIYKKPAIKKKTGTWKACRFILGTECCERLAYYGMSTNLVNYLEKQMNACDLLAGTECCERLAYYGMSTNLINYLEKQMNMENVTASTSDESVIK